MAHIIGIFGAKGGIAKTLTTINLAAALNYFGKNVTIIDANLTTPNIGLYLGVPIVPITLHDVLKGTNHISEATYLHPTGIRVIPSGISLDSLKNVDPENLTKVMNDLTDAEIVLLDTSSGLGHTTIASINAVDELLVITNPEIASVTDALKTIRLAESMGKEVLGIIVTRTGNKYDMTMKNISTMLEKPIVGIIPEDKNIRYSTIKKDSIVHLFPTSPAAVAYKKLAAGLIGKRYEEKISEKGFLHLLLSKFGLK